jgi:heavy metal sensor kinase
VNRQSIRVRLAAFNACIVILTFAATGGGAWLAMRDSLSDSRVPVDEVQDTLAEFAWAILAASPFVFVLAAVGGYLMSRRALGPVDRITRTAQLIHAQRLTERLPLRGVDDELERLSATLNGMFGRLDDAFRRVRQFTADASHELRTPVTIIRSTAEVTRAQPRTGGEYAAALDRILAETERTSRLIDDLLLLARADADAVLTTMTPIDLADVLRDACHDGQIWAQAAGLQFAMELPPTCATLGDGEHLRRLFVILLDNAVKYTPARGVVRVTMRVGDAHADVEIRDTGVGIGAVDRVHIFERFYRAAADRARPTGGTGLGLSIAEWIATCHHGRILVESELGTGSLFRVSLPLVSPE